MPTKKKTVKKTAAKKPATSTKKKSSGIRLDLVFAANELNQVCAFNPPIPTTDSNNETLINDLKEGAGDLTAKDKLSAETTTILKNLLIKLPGVITDSGEDKELDEMMAKKKIEKKTTKKAEPKAKSTGKKTVEKTKSVAAPKGEKKAEGKTPAKPKKKVEPKERKPRVIETIWDVVTSNKKILSNDEILERVAKKLPDKNPDSMVNTIKAMNIQYLQKCFKK